MGHDSNSSSVKSVPVSRISDKPMMHIWDISGFGQAFYTLIIVTLASTQKKTTFLIFNLVNLTKSLTSSYHR